MDKNLLLGGGFVEVFKEEEGKLKGLYIQCKNEINSLEKKKYKSVSRYATSSDYESLDNLSFKKNRNSDIDREIAKINNNLKELYIARLDLIDQETKARKSYYIGRKSIYIDKDIKVHDWREDLGSIYYDDSLSLTRQERKYRVALKRNLDVEYDRLNKYKDLSVDEEADLMLDPYLKEILSENRQVYKVGDIIKSIQASQNKIIRYPAKDNFILQGCAGSGKSMILLHRLSQLIYKKKYQLEDIVLILASDDFNKSVDGLASKLELGRIERFSLDGIIEAIYSSYRQVYRLEDIKFKEGSRVQGDIASKEFLESFKKNYYNQMDKINDYSLHSFDIEEIQDKIGLEQDYSIDINNHRAFQSYGDQIRRILIRDGENNQKIANLTKIISRKEEMLDEIDKIKLKLRETEKNKDLAKDNLIDHIHQGAYKEELLSYSIYFDLDKSMDIEAVGRKLKELMDRIDEELEQRKDEFENLAKIDMEDPGQFKELCNYKKSLEEQIKNKEEDSNRGFKKFHLNESSYSDKNIANLKDLKEEIGLLNEEKSEVYNKLLEIMIQENNRLKYGDSLEKLEIIKSYIQPLFEDFSNKISNWNKEIRILKGGYNKYQVSLKGLEAIARERDNLWLKKLDSLDLSLLNEILDFIETMDLREVFENIYKKTMGQHGFYGDIENNFYRDYYLVFLSLYYGPMFDRNLLVNIDEAQDLRYYQWELIKNYYGAKASFNLYGDQLQKIDPLAMEAWEDFGLGNPMELNENYRNSRQMVEYINRELDMDIRPLGINGPEVTRLDRQGFENEALRPISQDSEGNLERVALIYKELEPNGLEFIRKGPWGEKLEKSQISLLKIDQAKGQEFERVYVLEDGMLPNELYIAVSRGLRELFLIGSWNKE